MLSRTRYPPRFCARECVRIRVIGIDASVTTRLTEMPRSLSGWRVGSPARTGQGFLSTVVDRS